MAAKKRQAKKAPKRAKRARLRVPLSNPGKPKRKKTMATKKRKSGKRKSKKLHGAAAAAHAKKHSKRRTNPGKPKARRSKARRRSSGAFSVTTRVRRNPAGMGWKKLAIVVGSVVVGGGAGVLAARQVEAHVAQPPMTLGLLEIGLGALGLFAAMKIGHPLLGLGFAAGAGANGALAMAGQVAPMMGGAGAAVPALPPGAAAPALPPGAPGAFNYADGTPFGMGAVVDADDDLGGAEGLAAIEEATDVDEDGNPIFDDPTNPYTGSDVAYS